MADWQIEGVDAPGHQHGQHVARASLRTGDDGEQYAVCLECGEEVLVGPAHPGWTITPKE